MPSSLLVALQLVAMVAAVLPAGAASWHPAGYLPVAAAAAFVRHPMYLAVLLFAAGFALGWRGVPQLLALALLAAVLHVKASREERLLAQKFPEYCEYAARTARIVPGLR